VGAFFKKVFDGALVAGVCEIQKKKKVGGCQNLGVKLSRGVRKILCDVLSP